VKKEVNVDYINKGNQEKTGLLIEFRISTYSV